MNIYWNDLIKRICQEASKYINHNSGSSRDSAAVITVKIVVHDNQPKFWIVENSCKIEPSKMVEGLLK